MKEPTQKQPKKAYRKPEIARVELVPEQAVLGSACHSDSSCVGGFAFPFGGIDPITQPFSPDGQ
ncbi:MAG: hypothetical protein JW862_01375 [Anaerolineales bacterium]|nr:hypothetical protein [Anaerolineales bacterium]